MISPMKLFKRRVVPLAHLLLVLSLFAGMMPTQVYAGVDAPNACTSAPAGLPDFEDRTDFCVYYNDANTTDAQADTVADHMQLYWDRYIGPDFSFRTPLFSGKLGVHLTDNAGCNGSTGSGDNFMTVFDGCFGTTESIKKVTGHELFHRVQFAYDTDFAVNWWMTEGTARAMEDLAFLDIDNWATSLTAVSSSFNKQVNEYLGNTNVDITSQPQRYNSALWWKYMTEQFGSITTEPQRGVDALLHLWEAAETQDDIAAVNSALSALGAGVNFDGAFRRFTAANYLKDLANPPAQYNYIDEEEAGNPATYGPVVPDNGGTIQIGTAVTRSNQNISRYGARYYRAQPDAANCPVVSATFHTDSGPAFYHVITQKGNNLDNFATSTATDYQRSFFNDGLTRIVAIAGSTDTDAVADITLECVNPSINIVMPNDGAVAHVGAFNGPGKFLAQVQVHNGSVAGPVVAGLTVNDFKVKVNGVNALITSGAFIQEQYWLLVQAPNQTANGVYDLEITLEKSGTTTPLIADTNTASVSYDPDHIDHLLVIDRSGSMLSDGKMEAARSAAKFYVDITRLQDGLAVIPYNENVNPAPFTLREVTAAPADVRQDAKNYIDGITAGGLTSIGDGMREAVNERNASPTSNPGCSFVLMSDGMQNSEEYWSTIEADAIATGCPVTSIAFGQASDETLMQQIATSTGGLYYYNDVFTSGSAAVASADSVDAVDAIEDTALGLGDIYEYAQGNSEKRQRLLSARGSIKNSPEANTVQTETVMIDGSMTEALFALDWVPQLSSPLSMTLINPIGEVITRTYDFQDYNAGHLGWRISGTELMSGTWTMLIDFIRGCQICAQAEAADEPNQLGQFAYQVLVSGPSDLTLDMLLPDRLNHQFFTGQRMPIFAFISTAFAAIPGLTPQAIITPPTGPSSTIPLFDDGQHGDGGAGDGFYAGLYTLVNQATQDAPQGEPGAPTVPAEPNDEGSYRVRLVVAGSDFQRESLGSFSVQEGEDSNSDGLPDPFEDENNVTGDGSDPDLDRADNLTEYQIGTDPNNSDSDGSGENDGSEFEYPVIPPLNPLDPNDDQIVAPEFLRAYPGVGLNVIYYDVRPEYTQRVLYRSTSPTGTTWSLVSQELPVSGVYSDTDNIDNGTPYYYRYYAIDVNDHRTAVLDSVAATPSTDPFPPEKEVVINNDAPQTSVLTVTLKFELYGDHPEGTADQPLGQADDITEFRVSQNILDLPATTWQSYVEGEDVPWVLAPTDPGQKATVYVQFRDAAHNESLVVLDDIVVVEPTQGVPDLFIPHVSKKQP